jgi:Tol biopolymer transport system component
MAGRAIPICCLLLLAATIALLPPGEARAAFPGANGRLAFTEESSEGDGMYSIAPEGNDRRALTTGFEPSWSPDGRWVTYAFCCEEDRKGEDRVAIAVLPAEGGEPRTIAVGGVSPRFSPDGVEVVYTTERAVRAARVDGTGSRLVLRASGRCCLLDPTFSPDGSRIAFGGTPKGPKKAGIWTVGPDGAGLRRLTHQTLSFADSEPDYSPDGTTIVFQRRRHGHGIAVISSDGTGEQLLPNSLLLFEPVFSPAGTEVAAVHYYFDGSKNACGTTVQAISTTDFSQRTIYSSFTPERHACIASVSWGPTPAL